MCHDIRNLRSVPITNEYTNRQIADARALPAAEAARLAGWLGQAQAGRSAVVLVTGALGSGKSTFLDTARREAHARSIRLGELALPGPRLVAIDPDDEARPRRVVAAGLTSLQELLRLSRLAAERWLITLDDAHAEDPEEVASVARVLAGQETAGVLFLLCAAEGHEGASGRLARLTAQLGTIGIASMHRLGPWSGLDVQDLVISHIPGIPPAIRFGFEVAQVTGGNPALIRAYVEMAAALPEDERLSVVSGARRLVDLPPPPLVEQLILARTAALTGDTRRVLQTLALWGLPGDLETLTGLSGLPGGTVASALDELEEGGHVRLREDEAGEVGHVFELPDMASTLVLSRTAPSLLAQSSHRRAAFLLEGRELPPGGQIIRAQHHLVAGDLTTARAEEVVEAAAHLLRRGRWASARELLEPVTWAAVESDLPAHVLIGAVQQLAETYTRSGDPRTAERLIDVTRPRSGGPGPGYLASLQSLAAGWVGSGRELEAEATLRYVSAHPATPRESRYNAFAELVRLAHWNGRPERAIALAEYAREVHGGEPDAEANLWFQQALVSRMLGHPVDSLSAARNAFWLARRAGIRSPATRALVAVGEAWLDSESADRAVRWMRGAIRRAEREQVFTDLAWVRNRLIAAYIESGDWANAELAARRGLSFAASLNLPMTSRRSEAALALVQALTGRVWPAFLRTRVTAPDLANPLITTVVMTALYEQLRLAGRAGHARWVILQATEFLDSRRGWERLLEIEVLPRLAADHAEHGDLAGLDRVAERFAFLAAESSFTLPIARLELMVVQARQALLQERPAEAVTLLELARSGYQSMDYRWRWAQVSRVLGAAYVQSGRRARAVETLRAGYVALERLGAQPEARRVRAELQSLGGRAPRVHEPAPALTPRQTQVAILAARGLSDREIARELGMSVRTTTTHMSAILKRLKLRSRFELRDWVEQQPVSESPSA